jgi:hypothetical protein
VIFSSFKSKSVDEPDLSAVERGHRWTNGTPIASFPRLYDEARCERWSGTKSFKALQPSSQSAL